MRQRSIHFEGCMPTRRGFLGAMTFGAAYFTVPGLFAEELTLTPSQTEGPFYPDKLPLDTDNDLIMINDTTTPAVGEITWLSGRILGPNGDPIRNAVVEIWQADANGAYLHSRTSNRERRDGNFQGFGRFQTGRTGEYLFRTIKPVPYPGRTPHIHFAVMAPAREKFTTQCYIKGESRNDRDFVFREIGDQQGQESVLVSFDPIEGSKIRELAAKFDIVLGSTPEA
jgi:protocatechuate 3,4-dioxygenase beta subunit